jgi:hypothetical protein
MVWKFVEVHFVNPEIGQESSDRSSDDGWDPSSSEADDRSDNCGSPDQDRGIFTTGLVDVRHLLR